MSCDCHILLGDGNDNWISTPCKSIRKPMKVIIELDDNVSICSGNNEDEVGILIKPNSSNGLFAYVKIEELKSALRKMTAK